MKFLEKFNNKNEKANSIPLYDGVILKLPESLFQRTIGMKKYSIEKTMGKIHYNIYLDCKGKICELGFGTKEFGNNLTGRGLTIFNDIADCMSTIVKVAKNHDKNIESIIFEVHKDLSSIKNDKDKTREIIKENQRLELYKRTLKNKFPEYQIISKKDEINDKELFEIKFSEQKQD